MHGHWLKNYLNGGSGGSGGGGDCGVFNFVVNYNGGDPNSDVSFSDIVDAVEAGKSVVATLIKGSGAAALNTVQLPLADIYQSDRMAYAYFSVVKCARTSSSSSTNHDFSYYNLRMLGGGDFTYSEDTFTLYTPTE